jgi:hypothetical protein
MKKLLFLLLLLPFISHAQPDYKKDIYVKQQRCFDYAINGYNSKLIGNRIYITSQAYVLGGNGADAKIIILNKNFDTIKTNVYGGTKDDLLYSINELPNGNILLSGRSASDNGDVNVPANRATQIWFLEVDTNGNKIKSKTFGGTQWSDCSSTIVSKDGYIYATGGTMANDYEFTHPKIGSLFDQDIWLAKLDTAFNIIWTKIPTTANEDGGCRVIEVKNNKFLFSMRATDTALAVAGNQSKGNDDLVLFYVDDNGNTIWIKRIGGSYFEGIGSMFWDEISNNYYLIGNTESFDGDIGYRTCFNGNLGSIWLLKLDSNGVILHSKSYGSKTDGPVFPVKSIFYNNQIWISCGTKKDNNDFANNNNPLEDTLNNCWIGLFDSSANLIGKMGLKSNCVIGVEGWLEIDNKLYATGGTGGCNIGIINNYGCGADTSSFKQILLELGEAPLVTKTYAKEHELDLFTLYPNPTDKELSIKINEAFIREKYNLDIFTIEGKKIERLNGKVTNEVIKINTSNYVSGKYLVQVKIKNQKQTNTFIKR